MTRDAQWERESAELRRAGAIQLQRAGRIWRAVLVLAVINAALLPVLVGSAVR